MDEWLASIYGTNQAEDLEKTAQHHLLAKLAEEQGIDLSGLNDEQLSQLANEVLSDDGIAEPTEAAPSAVPQVAPVAQAAPAYTDAMAKEAQAKFEEADLLGRVMAHAYTQELEKIAMSKEAGKLDNLKGAAKGAFNSAKNRGSHLAERAGAKARSFGTAAGMKGRDAAGKASSHIKANKKAYGAGAAAGAAGFGAGRMSKEASAFEKLAMEQAAEVLQATGYDPSTGVDLYAQQQQAQQPQQSQVEQFQSQGPQPQQLEQDQGFSQEDQFQEALDQRSLEILEAAGYDVNEIVARLEAAQNGQA